ncbi:MAG: hypothetical protein ACLPKI_24610 [Streptosporangiaceae bacterium]
MDQDARDHLQALLDKQIKERFADGSISRVALLQYGDDPVIEPGMLLVRVSVQAPAEPAGEDQALEDWEHAHRDKMRDLRQELSRKLPEATRLEFVMVTADGQHTARIGMRGPSLSDIEERARSGGGELTPVMARLGPADLDTLDTLITAGIAPTRAEAVRWALARIRERPAYGRLRERARELDELKSQF